MAPRGPIPTAGSHDHVFPIPYQVDFSVESKGRKFSDTKRRIKWKFGFAHSPALFPRLYDTDEKYIGAGGGDNAGAVVPSSAQGEASAIKVGVECRGREHELILTWSLLTGKATIWCDNQEVFRSEGDGSVVSNPLSKKLFRSFRIPNSKVNGHHRVEVRCYAMMPMGAKNMQVDESGGTFQQYDLLVDGMSYFAMPPMFELGTDRMWSKVERSRGGFGGGRTGNGNGGAGDDHDYNKPQRSRSFDYNRDFDRATDDRRRAHSYDNEIAEISPKNESEEQRMIRLAMEASLRDYSQPYPSRSGVGGSGRRRNENTGSRRKKDDTKLVAVREDEENLIDFLSDDHDFGGERDPDLARGLSNINISNSLSDVSVLEDDDMTTASFRMGTAWNSALPAQGQVPPAYPSQQAMHQQPQQPNPYGQQQQQWGSFNQPPPPSPSPGASFAVPPPPTWEDYNNAFGASMSSTANSMAFASPPSFAGGGVAPVPPVGVAQQSQYGGFSPGGSMAGSMGGGGMSYGGAAAPPSAKSSKFDPLRADPFAS